MLHRSLVKMTNLAAVNSLSQKNTGIFALKEDKGTRFRKAI